MGKRMCKPQHTHVCKTNTNVTECACFRRVWRPFHECFVQGSRKVRQASDSTRDNKCLWLTAVFTVIHQRIQDDFILIKHL